MNNKISTTLLLSICIFCTTTLFAQSKKYTADWQSLDSRPTPAWFEDAKFGIFIHWGPYSVPAWTPKGTYSEWYQYWLETKTLFGNGAFKGDEVYEFHKKTFGEDFPYYNFGEMFKADLYDPDEWAGLFQQSGAKYVVITSKHHDGFTLWPSKEANDRGFPWNAVEVGAKRDLLGDLTTAVKKTDVKMGFYYSLYEWFHPWWQNDRERFVTEHFIPQAKDVIERYQPDIFWGDGEWSMTSDKWKTPELMAWLFNESSVKDKIVINDRWGKGIRQNHGGYYTTEYEAGVTFDHPWEECRGMGFSFGYNQAEDVQDYNSAQTMVLMLCDIVSNGGNLLLDIGPDGKGNIPVIMQERLQQIGKWLKTNGEAIYGTRAWRQPVQWTGGNREFDERQEASYTGGEYILKQTVNPDPGYAAKEIFFTWKKGTLYAICPKWPGKNLTIKNLPLNTSSKIKLLATGENVGWQLNKENLVVTMPEFNPNNFSAEDMYAYVFEITNVPEFLPKPEITVSYSGFTADPTVTIKAEKADAGIYYTLDNSGPSLSSTKYLKPIKLESTHTVKVKSFAKNKIPSDVVELQVIKFEYQNSVKVSNPKPGIQYSYYELEQPTFADLVPGALAKKGVASYFNILNAEQEDNFGFYFEGYIKIERDDVYTFSTISDDGSLLFLNDNLLVDNGGKHGMVEKEARVALRKGYHKISLKFFESNGGHGLQVLIGQGNQEKIEIPENMLFHL